MDEDTLHPEVVISRFNRLMKDVMRQDTSRNAFQPWEIELLLDLQACNLRGPRRLGVLRQYQKAVLRLLEKGILPPMKLSEYLRRKELRRASTETKSVH